MSSDVRKSRRRSSASSYLSVRMTVIDVFEDEVASTRAVTATQCSLADVSTRVIRLFVDSFFQFY